MNLANMDWSLVQAFLSVAQEGSLSAAARRLGASQPTVGRQIKAMEETLGVDLFTRQARGLSLTDKGMAILEAAQSMEIAMNKLTLTAGGLEDGLQGSVRITASVFTAHHMLPPVIARIREEVPEISIELVPTDQGENLLYREADIAVRMFETTQLDVVTKYLGEIELGLFGATRYLDRVGRSESLEGLMALDWVGYDTHEMMVRGMRERGLDVTREWFKTRCDDHAVYWELIKAGCGIGFAQRHMGSLDSSVEQIGIGIPLPGLPIWLAAHDGMRKTPRIRKVWDMLEEGIRPFVS